MKVKELIAKLQKIDGELPVVVTVRDCFDDLVEVMTSESLIDELDADGVDAKYLTLSALGLREDCCILRKNNN